ncbi:T9SS type A sorting domain-containing protein [candidate division KSB1 bacterium]|nr:T9SS type A sorting domain-containing protein [candidate division KSB1 bacterium]
MNKYKLVLLLILILIINKNSYAEPDLRSKIGQMIMVGFGGTEIPDSLAYDIQQRNLGGVICLAYNLENPVQIANLTQDLQDLAATPLILAIDEEGGIVARLDENNGYEATYTAYTLGTVFNREDSTRSEAGKMADWLAEGGFNLNLAPVIDVNVNPTSPAIGNYERSFSADPATVYRHAAWYIDEFHKRHIMTALKHYPGHGSAVDDSHDGFTDISNTWSQDELLPYRYLIDDGYADFVMAGHLYNSVIDEIYPATLSYAAITSMLRDEMHFNGAVISDAMYMRAIMDNYEFDEAIELAINAGVDLLLYTTNMRDERSLPGTIIDIVSDKVNQGIIPVSRINEAYQRIMDLKRMYLNYTPVIADNDDAVPTQLSLAAYPNPFNQNTTIMFSMENAEKVNIKLYNMSGQLISVLASDEFNVGHHRLQLDSNGLSSGVYFVCIETAQRFAAIKINLIK